MASAEDENSTDDYMKTLTGSPTSTETLTLQFENHLPNCSNVLTSEIRPMIKAKTLSFDRLD